jgi:nitrate/TMAO reductase-like tetraheme cytochrome c subunit
MTVNIGGEFEHTLWLPGAQKRHASRSQCHLPQEFVPRLQRKLRSGRELYHHLIGTLATPERFEARRMVMARAVWRDLRDNHSGECHKGIIHKSPHAELIEISPASL